MKTITEIHHIIVKDGRIRYATDEEIKQHRGENENGN